MAITYFRQQSVDSLYRTS